MAHPTPTAPRRRPTALLAAGAAGSLALALSMTGTLSAFTASIQNSTNTAATGYLAMKETLLDSSGTATSTTCSSNDGTAASVASNSATCSTINKYGGTGGVGLTPGGAAQTTNIRITNTGNVPATAFTLTPGTCTATATGGSVNSGTATSATVCSKVMVTITSGSTTLYTGNAGAMTNTDLLSKLGTSSLAAGASIPITFSVKLDSSADNTTQGFTVSQPLTWTFNA